MIMHHHYSPEADEYESHSVYCYNHDFNTTYADPGYDTIFPDPNVERGIRPVMWIKITGINDEQDYSESASLSEEEVLNIIDGKWETDDHKQSIRFSNNNLYYFISTEGYSSSDKSCEWGGSGTFSLDLEKHKIFLKQEKQIFNKYGKAFFGPNALEYFIEDDDTKLVSSNGYSEYVFYKD